MNIKDIKIGQKVKVFPPLLAKSNTVKYGMIIEVDRESFTVDVKNDHIYIYRKNEDRVKHCMEVTSHEPMD